MITLLRNDALNSFKYKARRDDREGDSGQSDHGGEV